MIVHLNRDHVLAVDQAELVFRDVEVFVPCCFVSAARGRAEERASDIAVAAAMLSPDT